MDEGVDSVGIVGVGSLEESAVTMNETSLALCDGTLDTTWIVESVEGVAEVSPRSNPPISNEGGISDGEVCDETDEA